jgi:hypothetical protein
VRVEGTDPAKAGRWRHVLAIGQAALDAYPAELEKFTQDLELVGDRVLRAKESALHARLWHIDVRLS